MKTVKLLTMLFLALLATSCSNDDDNSNNNPPVTTDGFFYSENGATTMQTVNTPYASAQFKSIFAVNSSNTIVEMNLSSIAPGNYTIDGTTNSFSYLKPGSSTIWSGTAGSVVITANANNKLTGTFSITAGSGTAGVNTVSGTFTNIVINP